MHIVLILLLLTWLLAVVVVVAVCLMAARDDKARHHPPHGVSLGGVLRTGSVCEQPLTTRRGLSAENAFESQEVGRGHRRRSHADLGAN
jgi:hypothetical protein